MVEIRALVFMAVIAVILVPIAFAADAGAKDSGVGKLFQDISDYANRKKEENSLPVAVWIAIGVVFLLLLAYFLFGHGKKAVKVVSSK